MATKINIRGLPTINRYEKDDIQTAMVLSLLQIPDSLADKCNGITIIHSPMLSLKANGKEYVKYLQVEIPEKLTEEQANEGKVSQYWIDYFTDIDDNGTSLRFVVPPELDIDDEDDASDGK